MSSRVIETMMQMRPRDLWRRGWVSAICRLTIAALFAFAAVGKVLDPEGFAETIEAFQLVPGWAVNPTAILLPWIEIVAAFTLVLPTQMRAASAIILGILLSCFTLAMLWVIAKDIDTQCGCFGTTWTSGAIGWWSVSRNLLMLGILIAALIPPRPEPERQLAKVTL